MILILSSSGDVNVDYVITWLDHYNYNYKRINADEIADESIWFSVIEKKLIIKDEPLNINEINAVWFRKFGRFRRSSYYKIAKEKVSQSDLLQISNEYNTILRTLILMLKDKKWLTSPWSSSVNKLDILSVASKYGFAIPETFIISNKKDLINLVNQYHSVISKSVYEPHFIEKENGFYSMFTKEIEKDDIGKFPDTFFPSLIQKKISKQYELRIFYLDGKFFTMAIFSQSNKQTELDFRKHDWDNPSRRVPYKLPNKIENNLHQMLQELSLNCCSIDMIKSSDDNKYYFLEINPTGEFGMTSFACNYEVYNAIASTLIKMDS